MATSDFDCDVCGEYNQPRAIEHDDVTLWLCAACEAALKHAPRRTSPWMVAASGVLGVLALSSCPLMFHLLDPDPVDRELLQIIGFGLCSDATSAADYLAMEAKRPAGCEDCEYSYWYMRSGWESYLGGGNLILRSSDLCDSQGRAEARSRAFWKNGDGWRERPPRLYIGPYWEPGGSE